MDTAPDNGSLLTYLKTHPFIPISLSCSLLALCFGAYSLLQAPSAVSSSARVNQTEEESDALKTTLTVDIEGYVARPGLLIMESSSGKQVRIAEVIEKAGGFLPEADKDYIQRNINLASIVTDGMKLYIPTQGETTSQSVKGATTVNVNTATMDELEKLAGIGATRAQAIIAGRPYGTLEDLETKIKLPSSVIEKIKNEISF